MSKEDKKYVELLDSFMRGNISHEDKKILLEWFDTEKARNIVYSHYENQWNKASLELSSDIQMRMFDNIQAKIQQRYFSRIWRYASVACLLILVSIGSYFFAVKDSYSSSKEFIVAVDKGQKANLTLPDGTRVWLNSASEIKYDDSYNDKERRITLEGEAYFEVEKHKSRRFIVTTNNIDVEALGTSFNVKSYLSDREITVTLVEGKLRVSDKMFETFLDANERLVYNKGTHTFDKKNIYDVSNIAVWRNNELAFYGETLEEIGAVLSRMYNVDIVFTSESVKHYSFSGKIRNNSLTNVLEIISMTAPIKYKIFNNTIEISANQ